MRLAGDGGGPGTIILAAGSAADAYVGKWKLTGGTLEAGASGSLGAGSFSVSGGVLKLSNASAMASGASLRWMVRRPPTAST